MVETGGQKLPERFEGVGDPPLDDVEHHRLGPVQCLGDVLGEGVAHLGYLPGDPDEPAQQGVLLDDPGIAGSTGNSGRTGLQRYQVAKATYGFQ